MSAAASPPPAGPGPCLVVGYDGSLTAKAALTYAISRAGRGGTVVAVFGYEPASDWLSSPSYQQILDDHQTRGRAVLDAILLEGNDELLDTNFETDLIGSPPAEAIVAVAQSKSADEIVVGSRGFGRLRAALGSVSHELLHRADRPVVVIPPAYEPSAPSPSRG